MKSACHSHANQGDCGEQSCRDELHFGYGLQFLLDLSDVAVKY
jgi:hypothetical protein